MCIRDRPTVVATDASGKEILAVGNDAAQMTGKTDGDVRVVWPLKDSVIVHCNEAGGMLEEYINTACLLYTSNIGKPLFFWCKI